MNGFSWADATHDDGAILETVLPAATDVVDPVTAIRTHTEFFINEKGRRVQIIRKFKTVTRQVKVNKNVERRKHMLEFGDAKGQTEAMRRNVTYFATDEITLDLSKRTDADEADDPLNKLAGNKSIVICRLCGAVGDHWTLKCPKRDTLALPNEASAASADNTSAAAADAGMGGAGGRYVVPAQRAGARVTSSDSKDDMPTIRLTNLSEDTTESDLSELLSPFGNVTRIRLAKDRVTMRSKGYAFISFSTHSSAAKAIEKLQGFGYDNLILRAEWSRSMQQLVREREEKEALDRAASSLR